MKFIFSLVKKADNTVSETEMTSDAEFGIDKKVSTMSVNTNSDFLIEKKISTFSQWSADDSITDSKAWTDEERWSFWQPTEEEKEKMGLIKKQISSDSAHLSALLLARRENSESSSDKKSLTPASLAEVAEFVGTELSLECIRAKALVAEAFADEERQRQNEIDFAQFTFGFVESEHMPCLVKLNPLYSVPEEPALECVA